MQAKTTAGQKMALAFSEETEDESSAQVIQKG